MKFSRFATLSLAAFAIASPITDLNQLDSLVVEHVPDESKRQDYDSAIDSMTDNFFGSFPDKIEDPEVFQKVFASVQNMVATLMSDTKDIIEASGVDPESYLYETDFQTFLETMELNDIGKRAFFIAPIAKALLLKLMKGLLKNAFKSLLGACRDAGVKVETVMDCFEKLVE